MSPCPFLMTITSITLMIIVQSGNYCCSSIRVSSVDENKKDYYDLIIMVSSKYFY